jgi:hypothetical protein
MFLGAGLDGKPEREMRFLRQASPDSSLPPDMQVLVGLGHDIGRPSPFQSVNWGT